MFYDREEERKTLTNMLKNPAENVAKIVLLVGYSGVGKTGLMSELFSTTLCQKEHMQLHISNIASTSIESCYYFNRLYEELLNRNRKQSSSDTKSLRPLTSLRTHQFVRFVARWIASFLHIYESESLLRDKKSADLSQKLEFVIDALNCMPCIVDIENIQKIDMQSLEFLGEIVKRCKQSVFVFEYTLEEKCNDDIFYKFYSEIERFEAETEIFRLERLNEVDALRLSPIQIRSPEQKNKLLETYHKKNGNLYQILLCNEQVLNISDQIHEKVCSFVEDPAKADELFLLNLCYLNGGSISKELLRVLTTLSTYGQFHSLFSERHLFELTKSLADQSILKSKNGTFCIHDSVLFELQNQKATPILFKAYKTLVQHYTMWTPVKPEEQVYRLSQLFSLYLRFADDQIISILPDIRRAVIACKYPQAIYHSLNQFAERLEQQQSANPTVRCEIYKLLAEICIEAGDKETALEMFGHLGDCAGEEMRLLKARIYELGMTQNDYNEITKLIEASPLNSYERFLLELSRIHVALRIKTQAEAFSLIMQVVKNCAYQQYPEYAFALADQAELIDSPSEAVALYQKGIRHLTDCNMKQLAGYLYTNICMSYGYLGELQLAEENLKYAKKAGIDEAVYLNNIAALQLLRGIPTEKTESQLTNALLLRSNFFERLIIHNNLLITLILLRKWSQAEREYDYLRQADFAKFQYGEFLQMYYQNLLFYCREHNLKEDEQLYRGKLLELIESPSVTAGTRKIAEAMLRQSGTSNIFYAKYPYRAEFLCYWGIPPSMWA